MTVVVHPCEASDILKTLGKNPDGKRESSKAWTHDRPLLHWSKYRPSYGSFPFSLALPPASFHWLFRLLFSCPPAGAVTHSPPNQPGCRFFAFLRRLSTAPRLRTLPRRVQSFIGCPGLKWDARVLFQVYSRVNISLIRIFRTMDKTYALILCFLAQNKKRVGILFLTIFVALPKVVLCLFLLACIEIFRSL